MRVWFTSQPSSCSSLVVASMQAISAGQGSPSHGPVPTGSANRIGRRLPRPSRA